MAEQRIETQLKSLFGFKAIPFTSGGSAKESFAYEGFTQALKRLRYLADRRGIGLLVGGSGTGKSTLIRAFIESLGNTAFRVGYICRTTCAVLDLYLEIGRQFGVEPAHRKSVLAERISERLASLSRTKHVTPVLIIDEGHLLPRTFLDELRIITNFEADSRDELVLVLAGHPQLETNLKLMINEAFAQRVVQRIRLKGFCRDETKAYVLHRLEQVGRTAEIFTEDGLEALHKASRGIPRLIDRLAEQSLLLALWERKKEVDAEIIGRAHEEFEQ